MKKIAIFTISLIMILNFFNISYGAESKILRAKFTEEIISGTDLKKVTINPYRYSNKVIEDSEDYTYSIYLPSGYLVEGKTASYTADVNGKYPFTVYDGKDYKTFIYTKDDDVDPIKKENIFFDYELKYDYEKKQVFFNISLDRLRNITTPDNNYISNDANYYIKSLKNNVSFDFTVIIDEITYDFRIIKQGEFYLLVCFTPVNYDNYSTIVSYKGYNFTTNQTYTTHPEMDIYDDNGIYEVLVKSSAPTQLFCINIDNIDYRRPSMEVGLLEDYTFNIEAIDDFNLNYIITFDGQYVPAKALTNSKFIYNHNTEIIYNGEYIFTAVDNKGNRAIETVEIKNKRRARPHEINLDVHDFKNTNKIFENIGQQYVENKYLSKFTNILPSYMNGKSPEKFNPNSPISRAEMITIFCRLNDLPYDNTLYLKTKFTDISNHWARDYISMGSSKKYISGYKDNTYKPNNNVTRAEFCQMLTKISSYKSLLNALPSSSNINFIDIDSHWAKNEIVRITSKNLIETTGNNFNPDSPITRGEVVYAINKLYGINPTYIELAHINSLYNKYYNFNDIGNSKYYYDIIVSVIGMYREKIN